MSAEQVVVRYRVEDDGLPLAVKWAPSPAAITGATIMNAVAEDLGGQASDFTFEDEHGQPLEAGKCMSDCASLALVVRSRHREPIGSPESAPIPGVLDFFAPPFLEPPPKRARCDDSSSSILIGNTDGSTGSPLPAATSASVAAPSISDDPFAAGSVVWARLSGFPWWPARVRKPKVRTSRSRQEKAAAAKRRLDKEKKDEEAEAEVEAERPPLRVRFYGARRGKADVAVIPAAFVVPFPSRSDLCEVKLRKKSMQPSFRLAVTEAREACARRERRRCAVTGDGPGMSSSDCGDDGVARGESYDEDDSCSLVSSESEASSDEEDEEESDCEAEDESMEVAVEVAAEEGEGEGEGEGEDAEEEAEDEEVSSLPPHVGPPIGTIVWARLPSFPMWPATIAEASTDLLPLPHAPPSCFVRFLGSQHSGSRDVAWVDSTQVCPFEHRRDLCSAKLSKRSLRPKYRRAVAEAQAALGGEDMRGADDGAVDGGDGVVDGGDGVVDGGDGVVDGGSHAESQVEQLVSQTEVLPRVEEGSASAMARGL